MPIDLYNDGDRWKNWREGYKDKDIEEISKKNSDIIKKFLFDMEVGNNVATSNKKGARSFSRLNVLRNRIIFLTKIFERKFKINLTESTAQEVSEVFNDMRKGEIKKQNGGTFKSSADYVKCFKSFWHWHMKSNRQQKKPKQIIDITEDLDTSYDKKPEWVYIEAKKMDELISKSNPYYKPLISFFYDTGCRVSEGFSIMVDDVTKDKHGNVLVDVKDEYSKGGRCGRKIKLMLCGKEILNYIKDNKLKSGSKLFSHSVFMTNEYLGKLAKELFGEGKSEGGEKFSNMTLYDLRHNSCCFWLDRYKHSSDLMYRFGWRSEKYIHYYSEFLGKNDKISQEDMYIDITKTELEKELNKLKKKLNNLSEEAIKKQVYENMGNFMKEQNLIVKEPVIFGSSMKQKPFNLPFESTRSPTIKLRRE